MSVEEKHLNLTQSSCPPHGFCLDVPANYIASVISYLQLDLDLALAHLQQKQADLENWSSQLGESYNLCLTTYNHLLGCNLDTLQYKKNIKIIGEKWLWHSRLWLSDSKLQLLLEQKNRSVLLITENNKQKQLVGMLELVTEHSSVLKVEFLGVTPHWIGKGLGNKLIELLKILARNHSSKIIQLTTCTLDHPNALEFYLKHGFEIQRQRIEIVQDPRANNILNDSKMSTSHRVKYHNDFF